MNLRLARKKIRFRISKVELDRLIIGDMIEHDVSLPHGLLRISVAFDPENKELLSLETRPDVLALSASPSALKLLNVERPPKHGVMVEVKAADGSVLTTCLEVDIKPDSKSGLEGD